MSLPNPILADDEPEPFELVAGDNASPFVLIVDHAANRIPRCLSHLGLSGAELATHIAWDIGIEAVSRSLARSLNACLVVQRYSRLVIDCNRPLESATSIVTQSAGITVPSNLGLSSAAIEQRRAAIFHPYHEAIVAELVRRRHLNIPTILIAMHSFTPLFMGLARSWHVGVLYQRDTRLAHRVLSLLRKDTTLTVGDNQPYSVSDASDYSIIEYGERRSNLHVALEVRQDLIDASIGQRAWAERLRQVLLDATAALGFGGQIRE